MIRVVGIELPYFKRNLPNGTTLRLGTEIYHFLVNRVQFKQMTNLYPIDRETDRWVPFASAEVAKTGDGLGPTCQST
jgi:hypothetical protein